MRMIVQVKELLYKKGWTLTFLAEQLGKKLGKKYSLANLSNKLTQERISHKEMMVIADILGYKINFTPKEE